MGQEEADHDQEAVEAEEDEEWTADASPNPSRSRKRKTHQESGPGKRSTSAKAKNEAMKARQARLAPQLEELEARAAAAQFFVSLATGEPDQMSSSAVLATLGTFQFTLAEGQIWQDPQVEEEEETALTASDECWIYLSRVPQASFVYRQWFVHQSQHESPRDFKERVKRGHHPDYLSMLALADTPNLDLLEAFGPNIGPKRRGASLLLESVKDDLMTVKVVVTEGNLASLNHPSDVPVLPPVCVRRTLNHFLLPPDVFNDEEEEADVEHLKPDIDDLYEVSGKSRLEFTQTRLLRFLLFLL
jgi:hypothetical protein